MGEATYTRDGNVIYDGDLYVPDARLARAEEALERYGQHDSDCPIEHGPSQCTCGLIAALTNEGTGR